ncbi:MAG: diphthine--ammonia ligase [Candidatus Omnitrophota bacterium]|nr:MAG: diphthine--ammonia ligase [Candidatus Omnitrophota bacterium]
MKAFISWSGGKETALSCYKAIQNRHIQVSYLLNMISEDGKHSRSHGVSSKLLKLQAEAIGIPIIQRRTAWKGYEGEFKKAVSRLKEKGVDTGIFGDIDLQEHRDWIERVCKDIGIKPVLPLWKKKREELLKEFIRVGFETIVISVRADILGKEWLGRHVNEDFINDLKKKEHIDLCGEAGEYHTLVVSGPIFKKNIMILNAKKIKNGKHWFLDILDYEITEKV